ncbi:hypothetical protein ROR02_15900 [Pararhodospirillum oryzae]|uniref:Uncharacterized protein n=1 Tax=Pararhodospirillum oryzae TaxID=478448 RepID=A0A512H7M9_9PROT|nr:hypothetical protein ROR02_15900 [Pararhodospirillum oryzae]
MGPWLYLPRAGGSRSSTVWRKDLRPTGRTPEPDTDFLPGRAPLYRGRGAPYLVGRRNGMDRPQAT